jgi:polygalacturonase
MCKAPLLAITIVLLASCAFAATVLDAPAASIPSDGQTLATPSIQKSVDALSNSGGGVLHFSAGRYLTGTIELKSNVTLHLDEGAVIMGSPDAADYRNLDPFLDGNGHPLGHALIVAKDADHVAIEGAGTIDGQGLALKAKQGKFTVRPFLIRFVHCTNVTVKDVHLTNPGAWTLNFFQTKGGTIDNVTIRTRDQHLANNDGINIDSSENIRINNCDVVSGDDALVIKSTSPIPSRDIIASNCKLSTSTNAIKLGTESLGGFENITISNCQIEDTGMSGIALYSVDGGELSGVTIDNVAIDGVAVPISLRLGSRLKTFRDGDKPKETGHLHDVTIKNITANHIKLIGILINGVPGHPIEQVGLENIRLTLPGGGTSEDSKKELPEKESAYPEYNMFGKSMPAYAIYARHVRGIKFVDIETKIIASDARPATVLVDVGDVTPPDFAARR